MAQVSPAVALRIANMIGSTPEYVMSPHFSDTEANDAIMRISAGESERLQGIIAAGPVVDWDLLSTRLHAAEVERGETALGNLVENLGLGGIARRAGIVFWVGVVIAGAYAYSLVKK